ncbi:43762_t:CDS:2, partial [Gigaspora margarita]
LIIDTYPVEEMSDERYDALLLARALRVVDNLFEARIKARENIRKSQQEQKWRHDQQHPLQSFEIEEKLDNVCEEIEAINPQIQSNAHVLEVYYKLGDLMAERDWNKEVRKVLCQWLTDSKGGLQITITVLERMWESDFSGVILVEARRLRDEETRD